MIKSTPSLPYKLDCAAHALFPAAATSYNFWWGFYARLALPWLIVAATAAW